MRAYLRANLIAASTASVPNCRTTLVGEAARAQRLGESAWGALCTGCRRCEVVHDLLLTAAAISDRRGLERGR